MGFWGVKWGSMSSMWFVEVQSGSQGFFEVHLASVRFNEVCEVCERRLFLYAP